jgi:hypothetical protein
MTFPGKPLRKIPYYKSYPIMSYEWDKLIKRINYAIYKLKNNKEWIYKKEFLTTGNILPSYPFAYIRFIRSQNNPRPGNPIGFCHYHTGINYSINNKWIQEIINKNNMKIGFTFVRENRDFLNYLTKDFLKDEEYIIPKNTRHYSCSQNIRMDPGQGRIPIKGSKFFSSGCDFKTMDDYFWKEENKILPFDEYIKKFMEVIT